MYVNFKRAFHNAQVIGKYRLPEDTEFFEEEYDTEMSANEGPVPIVTGVEEEKYEFDWKIHKIAIMQQDELLVESQKFEIHTGIVTTLQSKWIVGLKNIENSKTFTMYCKLMEVFSINETPELVAHFTVKLLKSKGATAWMAIAQGRMKVTECFDMRNQFIFNHEQSWEGIEDERGDVIFYIKLSLLNPFVSGCINKSTEAVEAQLKLKSAQISERNLSMFMDSTSTEFDTRIVCSDGQEVKCHKEILQANSPVFDTMLQSTMSEANTGVIKVEDLTSKTVKVILQYLYTGVLPKSWRDPNTIVEFTYAAGKYQLKDVLEYLDHMLGNTNEDPNTVLALLNFANKLSLKRAEAQLMDRIVKITISAKNGNDVLSVFGSGS